MKQLLPWLAAIAAWYMFGGLILVVGAPIALTYAAFWVYAKTMDWWDARKQRQQHLACATCSRPAVEYGRLDNEVGSTAFFCASCGDTAPNYRYIGML